MLPWFIMTRDNLLKYLLRKSLKSIETKVDVVFLKWSSIIVVNIRILDKWHIRNVNVPRGFMAWVHIDSNINPVGLKLN